jgi:hypothetical protein
MSRPLTSSPSLSPVTPQTQSPRQMSARAAALAGLLIGKRIARLSVTDLPRVRALQNAYLAAGEDIASLLLFLDWNVRAVNNLAKHLTNKARAAASRTSFLAQYVRPRLQGSHDAAAALSSSSLTVAVEPPGACAADISSFVAMRRHNS